MAKGSGSTRTYSPYSRATAGAPIAISTNGQRVPAGKVINIEESAISLGQMTHRDMEKEIQQAISRYEAVLGVRERTIKLANTPGAYGVTFINSNGSQGIYLNKEYFDVSKSEFEKNYRTSNYARRGGFKNTTRKPAQHTVTHELAHATWTSGYSSEKHRNAGGEIRKLYSEFLKDKSSTRKKNYGSYGNKNVDEFWAEIVTKAIHGDSDRYTRRAISIAKKYNL